MVGKHDAAGADTYGLRRSCNMSDHDCRRGTRDPRHVVVLGQPVAVIAEPLGGTGKVHGIRQGIGRGLSLGHGGKVEKREVVKRLFHPLQLSMVFDPAKWQCDGRARRCRSTQDKARSKVFSAGNCLIVQHASHKHGDAERALCNGKTLAFQARGHPLRS